MMEPIFPCRSRVDEQQAAGLIILDLQDMGMAADEQPGPVLPDQLTRLLVVPAGIAPNMGDAYGYRLSLKDHILRTNRTQILPVDIAADRPKRFESLQGTVRLQIPNIPCMPDLIHLREEIQDTGMKKAMGIGKNANFHLPAKILICTFTTTELYLILMLEYLIGFVALVLIVGIILILRKLSHPAPPDSQQIEELTARLDEATSAKRVAEEKGLWLTEQLQDVTRDDEFKGNTILELSRELAQKEAEIKSLMEKFDEQKAGMEQLQEKFRVEFKNLANEILEEKTKKFTEQNSVKLDEILKPLGEKIRNFEKKVEETYDKESKERFSLGREIKNLAELNQQISREATNLTNALKGQSKAQGNWGEIILESILEKSGLTKDREYLVQQSYVSEDGRRLQPDVVVNYPGDRHIVIDSKVSLTAYERFVAAESKEEQETALRDHLLSVKNHVNELSAKNYQDLYQLKSLDFVMMFLPVEPAYLVAMQGEPGLWNFAYEKRVLLISPTNLIAALRMISNLWRVENQNKNAQEIARQSGELLDKLAGFVNDLTDIGSKLDATHRSYDLAMNKLSTGKGNLVRRAERIRELGAKSSKELPSQLIDNTDDE